MGFYSEYLDRQLSFEQLTAERKKQLRRISEIRERDTIVYAADLNKGDAPISIEYSDLLPLHDQLDNLDGSTKVDLILETPGGSGEVAEDIVRTLHGRYDDVAVLVPGTAKSAGTIIAMAGDEILMEPSSSLGPIDAQLFWQGKVFSAHALIEGMEAIKKEVEEKGTLNKALIPMLQSISPGELQSAQNALDFAKKLVTEWLVQFKFKNWTTHKSDGRPVTVSERELRASEIAAVLCDHGKWLTHGRSIKLDDLAAMRLQIVDYSKNLELAEAIRRYYILLQMTFNTNIYKLIETVESQILRHAVPQGVMPSAAGATPEAQQLRNAILEFRCNACGTESRIQANLVPGEPLQEGNHPFPQDNQFHCPGPGCNTEHDLSDARRQIEAQAGKPIVD